MAEQDIQRDFKLTRAEQEKKVQAEAAAQLYQSYPLPANISSMKSFAFGSLTWRDVALIGLSEAIPIALLFPFGVFIPTWLTTVIGFVLGMPLAFLSIKHIFTGDLPIEERIRIAVSDYGESNLLNWDKTKKPNGSYVDSSTQSFVPYIDFGEENVAYLNNNLGGFAVIELSVDDMTQSKNTDMVGTVNSFRRFLDALIQNVDCTPIQIMLKSTPKNLGSYVEKADSQAIQLSMKNKVIASARAYDYANFLAYLDEAKEFFYKYYVVITYREDAEHVAENSLKSASIRREKIKEKGLNPLNKKAKMAKQMEFDVGMSQEERKKALREMNREAEFGRKRTREALSRRVNMAVHMLRDLGSTHTAVKPRLLTKDELSKLIFDCYNHEDKNIASNVLLQAIERKDALYSTNMYKQYPEIFNLSKTSQNKTLEAQKAGALGSVRDE